MSTKTSTIRNIVIFIVLANALAFLGPLLGGDPVNPGLGFLVWGTAPLVAALIMKYVLRDPVSLGWQFNFRSNGRWYLLSALTYPVIIALATGVGLLVGGITLAEFTAAEFFTAMAPLTIIFFFFAIFEEVGWRGYLVPKVALWNDGLLGHTLVGIVWTVWHLPYFDILWSHTNEPLVTLLPRIFISTIIFAIAYGEIRIRTGSVWPAVLMHWVGNAFANTLLAGFAGAGFVTIVPGWDWLVSYGGEGLITVGVMGLIGGILFYRRKWAGGVQASGMMPEAQKS